MAKSAKFDPSKPLKSACQEQFCQHIVQGMMQGPAYSAVPDYKSKSPDQAASQLVSNCKVAARIAYLRSKICTETLVDVAYVVRGFKTVAERCQQAEAVLDNEGNPTGEYRFDSSGANKALDSLAKHVGAYERDHELSLIHI